MKLSLPVLLLVSLLTAPATQAQVRFSAGPQAGYTLATLDYAYDNGGASSNTSYTSGFAAGVAAEIGFGHLAIQPAVQFAQKGYDQKITSQFGGGYPPDVTSTHARFNYLAAPVNVTYTQHRNGQGAQVFAGPYVGILLGGHYTAETSQPLRAGTLTTVQTGRVVAAERYVTNFSDDNFYLRRLDAGLQFGLGYRYQGLLLQASYSLGLRDLQPYNATNTGYVNPDPSYQNRVLLFSLAYLFGLKP